MKKLKTSEKILDYIAQNGQAGANELADYAGLTTRAIRKQLSNLLIDGKVSKLGMPPQVFYVLDDGSGSVGKSQIDSDNSDSISGIATISDVSTKISESTQKVINDNFLTITPSGERREGFLGFVYWCNKQNLPLEKTAEEYVKTLEKYQAYKKEGLIDGIYKIKTTFDQCFLDNLFYLDSYSIERFGKTKLGQLLLYAKQSQSRTLIKELVDKVAPQLKAIIEKYKVEAIGFIPPTVKREVQLMKELERQLNLSIPSISLVKLKTEISVPQKTLNKLQDRVENAAKTILVNDSRVYNTILLIDDALGSGATLNETAKKIKARKVASKVVGLAITGSFSGFEIISEV